MALMYSHIGSVHSPVCIHLCESEFVCVYISALLSLLPVVFISHTQYCTMHNEHHPNIYANDLGECSGRLLYLIPH